MMLWKLIKNTFFDAFKGIDELVNPEEFKDLGKAGEQVSYRALWPYFKDNLFRNVYLRDENNKLTEIDLIGVGKKGIYVFESKNYSGTIYGSKEHKNWICYLGKKKISFYSPILQNYRHICVLKHNFKDIPELNYFSVIIFSARCKIKVKDTGDAVIVKRDTDLNGDLDRKLREIVNNNVDCLTNEQVSYICDILKAKQRPDNNIKEEHLQTIK